MVASELQMCYIRICVRLIYEYYYLPHGCFIGDKRGGWLNKASRNVDDTSCGVNSHLITNPLGVVNLLSFVKVFNWRRNIWVGNWRFTARITSIVQPNDQTANFGKGFLGELITFQKPFLCMIQVIENKLWYKEQ